MITSASGPLAKKAPHTQSQKRMARHQQRWRPAGTDSKAQNAPAIQRSKEPNRKKIAGRLLEYYFLVIWEEGWRGFADIKAAESRPSTAAPSFGDFRPGR
jgi:hypothetical protein